MSNKILDYVAVILILGWAFGFFTLGLGAVIHVLLVIAVIAIILRFLRRRKVL